MPVLFQLLGWLLGPASIGGAAAFVAEHPHMSIVQIIGQLFATAIVLALLITVIVVMIQVIAAPRRSQ